MTTTMLSGGRAIRRIGLGGSRFCGPNAYGAPPSVGDCLATIGVADRHTLIDTADCYGPAVSEELIGAALAETPDAPLVATKVGLKRGPGGSWYVAAGPPALRMSTMDSLRRLRTGTIELLQLHSPSSVVPIEESVGALHQLRAEGQVARVGVCNVTLAQLERACRTGPVATVQNQLNLATITADDLELLSYCTDNGITFLAYQPLADGTLMRAERVRRVAARLAVHPAQLVLRALLRLSPSIVAIPGTANPAHARANLDCLELDLNGQDQAIADRLAGRARAMSGAGT